MEIYISIAFLLLFLIIVIFRRHILIILSLLSQLFPDHPHISYTYLIPYTLMYSVSQTRERKQRQEMKIKSNNEILKKGCQKLTQHNKMKTAYIKKLKTTSHEVHLCWSTSPGPGTYHWVWLIEQVTLHWAKLVFLFPFRYQFQITSLLGVGLDVFFLFSMLVFCLV